MKYLPKNTLAYYNAAPQVKLHDLSEMPTTVLGQATKDYRKTCGQSSPDNDALTFYALNHLAGIVREAFTPNEPLPTWAHQVMAAYMDVCNQQGKRMLHYILSICTREMRHLHMSGFQMEEVWKTVEAQHGKTMVDFIQALTSMNESVAVQQYMDGAPDVPLGHYIAGLATTFHKGAFSGGYGGPAWGNVADAASEMIHGRTSMEMLVDTGYTLAHNGGPIFNKGMMYHMWTSALITILDVQRSGQVPELLLDPQSWGVAKIPSVQELVKLVQAQDLQDQGFKGWVNWHLVDEMRPAKDQEEHPSKYENHKKKQNQLHPVTLKAKKMVDKVLHGKKVKIVGNWSVYPGQTVQVFERVA